MQHTSRLAVICLFITKGELASHSPTPNFYFPWSRLLNCLSPRNLRQVQLSEFSSHSPFQFPIPNNSFKFTPHDNPCLKQTIERCCLFCRRLNSAVIKSQMFFLEQLRILSLIIAPDRNAVIFIILLFHNHHRSDSR